jgi:hypothetical protein
MKERGWIEPIVERVVGQVLESHVAQLRSEIVRRVMEEIAAAPVETSTNDAAANSAPSSAAADLARSVAEIQMGTSQREILRALLDASARYAARVALFVVKGNHATGWQARGFANSDGVKDFALDGGAAAVSRAIGDRMVTSAPVADFDPRFLQTFGSPANGQVRVLPLLLKDKVAALIYADCGSDDASGLLDAGSLELLVLSTSAWLEVNSLRKQAQKDSSAVPADPQPSDGRNASAGTASQPAAASAPPFNDPFASHAPAFSSHAKAAAASTSAMEASVAVPSAAVDIPVIGAETHGAQSAVVEMEPALAEPLPVGHAGNDTADSGAAPASASASAISPEDQEVHRKAQRFARLLVDEIKLYNQAKVSEGRKKKDLYDRLKETIEKSRSTYQKRYGNTAAASANYFQHEIIRSLAEDDLSIMGANFRH